MRILCDSFLFYFEITSYWHVFVTLFGKTVTIINFSKKSSNFLTFVFYSFSKRRRCDRANVVVFFIIRVKQDWLVIQGYQVQLDRGWVNVVFQLLIHSRVTAHAHAVLKRF